jgi:TrmH family RNA methyltransferase
MTEDFAENQKEVLVKIEQKSIPYQVITKNDFTKLSTTQTPQEIIGIFKISAARKEIDKDSIIVGLENISDPGNLGTILRTCEWFGVKTVILSKECAEVFNPKVVRSSMGAVFKLNILTGVDLIENIKDLRKSNYNAYYADMNGIDYRKFNYDRRLIITFCNEAFGPSDELKEVCDNSITIPPKGNIDSLNVSAAAAIILAQTV